MKANEIEEAKKIKKHFKEKIKSELCGCRRRSSWYCYCCCSTYINNLYLMDLVTHSLFKPNANIVLSNMQI